MARPFASISYRLGTVDLLTGAADPSAGGGVVAAIGSGYFRTTGELWIKTGAGNTAWTKLGGIAPVLEVFAQLDIPANQAATALSASISQLFDTIQQIRAGSVIGMNVRFSAALAAGNATVRLTVNGVPGTLQVAVAAPNQSGRATQASGVDAFVAGDLIGATLATDAGFLPATTNDVEVTLEIQAA